MVKRSKNELTSLLINFKFTNKNTLEHNKRYFDSAEDDLTGKHFILILKTISEKKPIRRAS